MAKSIHTILKDRTIDVTHSPIPGQGTESATFDLPEWLLAIADSEKNVKGGVMGDEGLLNDLLVTHGILHGILHNGIQKAIIDIRAVARPKKEGVAMAETMEDCQERVDGHLPKPVKVPGAAKPVSPEDAMKALLASGMSIEDIVAKFAQAG